MKTIEEIKRETGVPILIADHQGMVTHVNERFEQIFGWRSHEIIGQSLAAIIPSRLRDAHHLGFSRFLTTGTATLLNQPLKLKAVTKDGTEFDAEHTIMAEQHQGQWIFGALIKPLTANVR